MEKVSEWSDSKLVDERKKNAGLKKNKIFWRIVFYYALFHISALYGFWLMLSGATRWKTNIFALFLQIISSIGITAGSHRLWSHRAYKARFALRFLLMIMNSIAYQDPIFFWARDHRIHHKHSDNDTDPHNVNRGFFFSHVGWIFKPKHPDFIVAKSKIDVSDLTNDSIVMFQKKNYKLMALVFCFILPTMIPVYFWGESIENSWFVPTIFRFVSVLNVTFSINSFAHIFEKKPYDTTIQPSENSILSFVTLGEGWHNYHHVFPFDYKTAEFGPHRFSLTTAFINMFAKIGWAYDLKTVSEEIIKMRVNRTGDEACRKEINNKWGWGQRSK